MEWAGAVCGLRHMYARVWYAPAANCGANLPTHLPQILIVVRGVDVKHPHEPAPVELASEGLLRRANYLWASKSHFLYTPTNR